MNDSTEKYPAFPSIPRLSREMIVTEKIDGTNAQVEIRQLDRVPLELDWNSGRLVAVDDTAYMVCAGSRNRWLTETADNFGFAKWVHENAHELVKLGVGSHYGEWWGQGIQRGYGLTEKRFSLFNVSRWGDPGLRPACCHVVPVLWRGPFDTADTDNVLDSLERSGSQAAPGFMKPEGIVLYHTASRSLFKKTLDGDGHKGARR